ncbi:MAG: flagellar motor protein MotB [Pigmentiphaga sp.]|nr:flagellar motor protein MotB [Pigmentiphaga sp.]
MSDTNEGNKPPIIVRRIKKGGHGAHHGGSWKIAYADFMTAMMAFFLLMWLLGSTSRSDLEGISEYFRMPLRVALSQGAGSGDPVSVFEGSSQPVLLPQARQKDTDAERQDRRRLEGLKKQIEGLIATQPVLQQFKDQILMDFTDEGLRIQLIDEQNRPMFDSGKVELKDYTHTVLAELVKTLNGIENRISIEGHTDATPYAGGEVGYSNWELSSERANTARRAMVNAGLPIGKVLRVIGLADSVALNAADPRAPENRRISIVVLNKRSEALLKQGGLSEVSPALPLNGSVLQPDAVQLP